MFMFQMPTKVISGSPMTKSCKICILEGQKCLDTFWACHTKLNLLKLGKIALSLINYDSFLHMWDNYIWIRCIGCWRQHGGEPLQCVLAYRCKHCVLAILNDVCGHILVVNKHIWIYIIESTHCQLLRHILSLRIYTNARWR